MATPEEVALIRASWDLVANTSEYHGKPVCTPLALFSDLFYQRFFEIDPNVKPLFAKANIEVLSRALMGMMGVLVKKVDQIDTIRDKVEALGKRHALYGVEKKHFEKLGEALIWAMKELQGELVTDQIVAAWVKVLGVVVQVMHEGGEIAVKETSHKLAKKRPDSAWFSNKWDSRVFTLEGEKLKRYSKSNALVESIELSEVISYDPVSESEIKSLLYAVPKHCLRVVTSSTTLYLGTDSPEQFKEWQTELEWRVYAAARSYKKIYANPEPTETNSTATTTTTTT